MKLNFLFILALAALTSCQDKKVDSDTLKKIADDFNKTAPRMIDRETKIDGIEIRQDTIIYKYTLVNLLAENVDTAIFNRALRPGILSVIKVSTDMKELRDKHINFEYDYRDKKDKFIYAFKISPKDYNP